MKIKNYLVIQNFIGFKQNTGVSSTSDTYDPFAAGDDDDKDEVDANGFRKAGQLKTV